jgi:dTDP-4-amino-4,6-dideoxygalactose transaminase
MNVPFADLYKQYLTLKPELDAAIVSVIETSAFIRGSHVEAFETAFAAEIGTAHCISCANGTDALYMAMVGLGVKPGDEVIVPAMSWISTSETVTQAGATVVFCDIDPVSYTLDPARLSEVITERTVGIIPVHLYGHPAAMPAIMQIAARHGLWVIEDCAQAHLAEIDGRKVGTFGAAATFSFYPGKNLGAMGDAGAVLSNDSDLARRIAMFARHGGLRKGDHEIEGINSRMDGLQAAILNVKLPHLGAWTARRQDLATAYQEGLAQVDRITLPRAGAGAGVSAVWHLYVLRSPARAELEAHLKSHGIGTARNYPRALPFLPCYARLQHRPEDFPIANTLAEEGLSIPIFAEMTDEQLQRVVDVIRGFDPLENG